MFITENIYNDIPVDLIGTYRHDKVNIRGYLKNINSIVNDNYVHQN